MKKAVKSMIQIWNEVTVASMTSPHKEFLNEITSTVFSQAERNSKRKRRQIKRLGNC